MGGWVGVIFTATEEKNHNRPAAKSAPPSKCLPLPDKEETQEPQMMAGTQLHCGALIKRRALIKQVPN